MISEEINLFCNRETMRNQNPQLYRYPLTFPILPWFPYSSARLKENYVGKGNVELKLHKFDAEITFYGIQFWKLFPA